MEYILAKELDLDKRLKQIEERKRTLANSRGLVNLAEIKTPQDLRVAAREKTAAAQARNAKLLQDMDIEAGKLHTRRLCPMHEQLAEQKVKFLRDLHSFQLLRGN